MGSKIAATPCASFGWFARIWLAKSMTVSLSAGGSGLEAQRDGTSRIVSDEFTCGDTKVVINENRLTVNDKSYGTLSEGDHVAVDYGKVRVNREVRAEVR